MVYGEEAEGVKKKKAPVVDLSAKVDGIMMKLDKSEDARISLEEFMKAEEKAPELFMTAFHLQDNLRTKILGMSYWKEKTKVRHGVFEPSQTVYAFYYES